MSEIPALLLDMHVACGLAAILCGVISVGTTKGGRTHRLSGRLFVVAMLVNGMTASVLGYLTNDPNDVSSGILTIYLVATSYMTAVRGDYEVGRFEFFAAALAALGAAFSFVIASRADFPVAAYLFGGAVAMAAILDVNMLIRRGLNRKHRLVRHLWRMLAGLFIAAGSFFLGQMQFFPEVLRNVWLLGVPLVVLLLLMVYWPIRVIFTDRVPG